LAGIGIVLLTTSLGGFAAYGLSVFLISFLEISNFEGGAGYFSVFVILIGAGAGFLTGLFCALITKSDFGATLLRAGEILLGLAVLTVVAVVLGKVFEDKGPKLAGDALRIQVEVKCPRDWKPDNAVRAGHFGCFLQKYPKTGTLAQNPIVAGTLVWDNPPPAGEPWVLSCTVPLQNTTTPRYMAIYTGKSLDLTLAVPLPKHPNAQHLEWSPWSNGFRYRVVKESDYSAAHPDAGAAFAQKRKAMLAALPEHPSVADWLPFYENDNEVPTYTNQLNGREVEAVREHPEQLLPLLRSADPTTQRRAVWATTFLKTVPDGLIEPLTSAGLLLIPMIRTAQEGFLPGDPDELDEEKAWSFYIQWGMAMDHAKAPDRRAILEQVSAQLEKGPRGENLQTMADCIKQNLAKHE